MFYLRLSLASNSTFIIFVLGLLLYSYDKKTRIETVHGRRSDGWAYIGRRSSDNGGRIEFEEGGHDDRGGRLGACRGGHRGR